MRMRRKKNIDSRIEKCGDRLIIYSSDDLNFSNTGDGNELLDLKSYFGNDNPIEMEIGCGKGRFISELARRNPHVNYIAVEKSDNVIVQACETAISNRLDNILFISAYAEYLPRLIKPVTVSAIYLNFSCPFPKASHAVHRLTHANYLDIYRKIMRDDAVIYQKTDNQGLFEFSIEQFSSQGFVLNNVSLDLHNSGMKGNIMTEYEEMFSSLGKPIYYLEARPDIER